jgi:predicted small lipoprotein YifL
MSLRPLFLFIILVTAALGTVSCGQKGPLYLPDQHTAESQK